MSLTPEQISSFVTKAKAAGASDAQIQKEIARKQAEVAEIERATEAVKTGILDTSSAYEAGVPLETLKAIPKEDTRTAAEKKQALAQESANKYLSDLKNLYTAGEGTDDDLSVGLLGRVGLKLKQMSKGGKQSEVTVGGKKMKLTEGERANLYKSISESLLSQVKAAAGESGNLTDEDMKRLRKAIPNFMSNKNETEALFNSLQNLVNPGGADETELLLREIGL